MADRVPLEPDQAVVPLIIIDTDAGYDPDDLVSMMIAAHRCPRLAVVTSDETRHLIPGHHQRPGRRACLLRHMLDLMDRTDVPVIEGIGLGGDRRFLLDHHLPPAAADPPHIPLVDGLTRLITDAGSPVVWVGAGPMSALARLLTQAPHLSELITVVQMGGWLDHYRNPCRASHNLDTDQSGANLALRLAHRPLLVLSEHTNVDELAIGPRSPLYRRMVETSAPRWAQLVGANFSAWWPWQRQRGAAEYSRMHDPLTLSAALGLPFVTFAEQRIRVLSDGRTHRDPGGREMQVSTDVDYAAFTEWMDEAVGL